MENSIDGQQKLALNTSKKKNILKFKRTESLTPTDRTSKEDNGLQTFKKRAYSFLKDWKFWKTTQLLLLRCCGGESQPMTSPTLDEARWTARLLQTNLIYSCVRSEAPVNPLEHLKYAPHLMPRRNAEHFHLKTVRKIEISVGDPCFGTYGLARPD
uniref:SFRICE_035092 n=1 Tax=Spodoptera frugiperda TaxID=7108 RepID=A0A2H1WG23_SPOFR